MDKQIAVVGGAVQLVQGVYGEHLRRAGLRVISHTPYKEGDRLGTLPKAAEAVLVISDAVSHKLFNQAQAQATQRGIPVVAVPRKWSQAEPILRMNGFMTPATASTTPPVSAADRDKVAFDYICAERRKGRVPKHNEVQAAVSRAFGLGILLYFEDFVRVANMAASQVPRAPLSRA